MSVKSVQSLGTSRHGESDWFVSWPCQKIGHAVCKQELLLPSRDVLGCIAEGALQRAQTNRTTDVAGGCPQLEPEGRINRLARARLDKVETVLSEGRRAGKETDSILTVRDLPHEDTCVTWSGFGLQMRESKCALAVQQLWTYSRHDCRAIQHISGGLEW